MPNAPRSSLPPRTAHRCGTSLDEQFMRRAIAMAGRNPRFPFGAVLVDSELERVAAEGVNRGGENPTWHGEIDVINRYAATVEPPRWSHLHLYTTAEPCCMCQSAILWAGIGRVVYGTSIATLQQHGWSQIDIRAEEVVRRAPFASCRIEGGILEGACDNLFAEARKT